jgi:hypothetical protein
VDSIVANDYEGRVVSNGSCGRLKRKLLDDICQQLPDQEKFIVEYVLKTKQNEMLKGTSVNVEKRVRINEGLKVYCFASKSIFLIYIEM